MNTYLKIKRTNGTLSTERGVVSFAFRKSAYLPYTTLSLRAYVRGVSYIDAAEVFFYVNEILVHHGLADSIKEETHSGGTLLMLSSRGFTSQLIQNGLEPGMVDNITFDQLMESYYTLPYVTHESNSENMGYIYMNGLTSMWESIVSFTYKLNGHYPYIRGTNCVRMTPYPEPALFSYSEGDIAALGKKLLTKPILSDFHMADINGEYGTYELKNSEAAEMKIVRHKYFDLDMEYLFHPNEALSFREKAGMREHFSFYCRYNGYNGEDISDIVTFPGITSERICGVAINGSDKGIFTDISVFHDNFPHE